MGSETHWQSTQSTVQTIKLGRKLAFTEMWMTWGQKTVLAGMACKDELQLRSTAIISLLCSKYYAILSCMHV